MRSTQRFAVLCGIAFALIFGATSASAATRVGFRILDYGTGSSNGSLDPAARLVRDAPSARSLITEWGMLPAAGKSSALAGIAATDFTRRSLIVAVGVEMPSPAFSLFPGEVTVEGGAASLVATIVHRGRGAATVLASPWAIVSVPREAVADAAPEVTVTLRCGPRVRGCHRAVT